MPGLFRNLSNALFVNALGRPDELVLIHIDQPFPLLPRVSYDAQGRDLQGGSFLLDHSPLGWVTFTLSKSGEARAALSGAISLRSLAVSVPSSSGKRARPEWDQTNSKIKVV